MARREKIPLKLNSIFSRSGRRVFWVRSQSQQQLEESIYLHKNLPVQRPLKELEIATESLEPDYILTGLIKGRGRRRWKTNFQDAVGGDTLVT